MSLSALPTSIGSSFGSSFDLARTGPATTGAFPQIRSAGRLLTWPAPASRWPLAARTTPVPSSQGSSPRAAGPGSADTAQSPARGLVLDRVTLPKPAAALAATEVSARFEPGLLHVIGGGTAAETTALLALLALTQRPQGGTVRWGDDDLAALDEPARAAWRRANLGLVCPTARLVSVMTVAEHLRLASTLRSGGARHAQDVEFAQALGLGQRLGLLPTDLTATERQGLAISQALCFGPRILLANDPTATGDATRNAGFAATVATTLREYARTRDAIVICLSSDAALRQAADTVVEIAPIAPGAPA